MFEYLMPALVMHEPRFSLLDQTNRRIVRKQIRYGQRHGLPWGISESPTICVTVNTPTSTPASVCRNWA